MDVDALIAAKLPPPLEEDELTIIKLREKLNCNYDTAKRYLKQWQEDGNIEYVGERLSHGHKVKAWRIVSEK